MLSKYTKKIEIKDGTFAVFNSLLCEPVYMNTHEVQQLFNEILDVFSPEEQASLYDRGILVRDEERDKKAYETLYNAFKETLNIVSLMYLMPTSSCNLACKYCFVGKLDSPEHRKIMSWDTAKVAIDKFVAHLSSRAISEGRIIFYGGEPTIGWDLIVKCARYINTNKFPVKIQIVVISNGTLMTKKEVMEAKELDIEFGISIDGPKDVNDSSRIFKSNSLSVYDRAMETIELLKKNNVKLGLSVTISEYYLDHEDEIINWLVGMKLPTNFNLLHYTNKNVNWELYYRKASKFILRVYDTLKQHSILEGRVQRKVESFYNRQFRFGDCAALGGNQITVCPDGEICICHGYWNMKEHKCGNILQDELTDIFQTDEFKLWHDNVTINKPECMNCEAVFTCGGGCAQQAETLFGDCREIDRCFCIHTKTTLKWLLLNHYLS